MVAIGIENGNNGKFSLRLYRGQEGDPIGFPREFMVDLSLFEVTNETMLVAAMLAFGDQLRDKAISSPPVQSELLGRILEAGVENQSLPSWRTEDRKMNFAALRRNTLVLELDDGRIADFEVNGPGRRINAHLLSFSDWTGRLFSHNDIYFGTNLSLLKSVSGVSEVALQLGVGVLMANDWQIAKFVISDVSGEVDGAELNRLRGLVSSIGCELDLL